MHFTSKVESLFRAHHFYFFIFFAITPPRFAVRCNLACPSVACVSTTPSSACIYRASGAIGREGKEREVAREPGFAVALSIFVQS